MKVFRDQASLVEYIAQLKKENKTIGFAPTMGALHQGHMSLYSIAKKENDIIVASVFVNPTQFNNLEDLEKYPRTEENDLLLLENIGVDIAYLPRIQDIYPTETKSKSYDFGGIENEMEGAARPGHFDGVGTVVSELLRQVQPDNAYFGEKDFQQLAIIRKLVEIKNLKVNIHGAPIFRAENGLALSSRNARLTEKEKEEALILYQTLSQVKEWFPTMDYAEIKEKVAQIFENTPYELEYFLIADEKTLKELEEKSPEAHYRAFLVVWISGVRLIDNMAC
ncbi:pantoate--beta-alanine ligase [Elizabethkingia sp. JS20170427COW]|uniref:pantoate--beta-alanine ligase n=1 Tax=Elizabethkingia sp. JS20170427COW TaxID=2583851 RepID=UPI0011103402|nr:pantoate--beta-alanine ligase [Elizabethkingia sp. JS20170427COW]QCX53553.1 pantoate--beta-alanine ligase [Elizabethkingia sp. JS20170427COW]